MTRLHARIGGHKTSFVDANSPPQPAAFNCKANSAGLDLPVGNALRKRNRFNLVSEMDVEELHDADTGGGGKKLRANAFSAG